MADELSRPLTYSDLEMSRVDALLHKPGGLSVVLEPSHAHMLISIIENVRALSQRDNARRGFQSRLFPTIRGILAGFRAAFFHPRLTALFRAVVYFSGTATWRTCADGSFEFRFNDDAPAI